MGSPFYFAGSFVRLERCHAHVDHAAHARLPPVRSAAGARRRRLSDRRARRAISGFRQRHRGQPARPRPSASDQGDPGSGGDADACVQPLRQPAGRGLCRSGSSTSPSPTRSSSPIRAPRRSNARSRPRARYHSSTGNAHKHKLITFNNAFHGRTLGDDQRDQPGKDARRLRRRCCRASPMSPFDDLDAALGRDRRRTRRASWSSRSRARAASARRRSEFMQGPARRLRRA